MLSDTGRLECVYLGTDPSIFIPPHVESRELNYSKMDAEMAQLQQRIKEKGQKAGEYLVCAGCVWKYHVGCASCVEISRSCVMCVHQPGHV